MEKITKENLKINPYFLSLDQLLEKNKAIIGTRKGTFLFNDLITTFHFESLPAEFQKKFKDHLNAMRTFSMDILELGFSDFSI